MEKNYKIVKSKRKSISLVIMSDGSLVVRAPLRATNIQIQEIIETNDSWIQKQRIRMASNQRLFPSRQYKEGESFYYLGFPYSLRLVDHAIQPLQLVGERFILNKEFHAKAALIFEKWYRDQAAQVIGQRVAKFAVKNGFQYQRIRISSARTRWGSCSSRGNLSFTWKLIKAPMPVIDAVVVHELVHTRFHNHGKEFWNLVTSIIPDYRKYHQWLKDNKGVFN
jgi:predicted metal-dependent hydrolase